jgi:hypothetical protein
VMSLRAGGSLSSQEEDKYIVQQCKVKEYPYEDALRGHRGYMIRDMMIGEFGHCRMGLILITRYKEASTQDEIRK